MDQRECSRISRRTSLTDKSHHTSSPLEGATDPEIGRAAGGGGERGKENGEINNSLAEFLWFNEDVEVGFLELLCKHAEDVGGGGEISQRVEDQVEEQLQERQNQHRYRLRGHGRQMLKKKPGHRDTFSSPARQRWRSYLRAKRV